MSGGTARPRSVTPRAAGSGGSLSTATSDAGRRSAPRPASLKLRNTAAALGSVGLLSSLRFVADSARALRGRCLSCGRPIRPWDREIHIHGARIHYACGAYQPRRA